VALGSTQDPAGLSLQHSHRPKTGGVGARCPLPKVPLPLSAFGFDFRLFRLQTAPPNSNIWLRLCAWSHSVWQVCVFVLLAIGLQFI